MKNTNLQVDTCHQLNRLVEVASWVAYANSPEEAQALVLGELRPLLETITLEQ